MGVWCAAPVKEVLTAVAEATELHPKVGLPAVAEWCL